METAASDQAYPSNVGHLHVHGAFLSLIDHIHLYIQTHTHLYRALFFFFFLNHTHTFKCGLTFWIVDSLLQLLGCSPPQQNTGGPSSPGPGTLSCCSMTSQQSLASSLRQSLQVDGCIKSGLYVCPELPRASHPAELWISSILYFPLHLLIFCTSHVLSYTVTTQLCREQRGH